MNIHTPEIDRKPGLDEAAVEHGHQDPGVIHRIVGTQLRYLPMFGQ